MSTKACNSCQLLKQISQQRIKVLSIAHTFIVHEVFSRLVLVIVRTLPRGQIVLEKRIEQEGPS